MRARQNVIFELGFFLGKLGRKNVVAVFKQDLNFEIPSDYSGVLYTPYDDLGRWQFELIKELKACGYNVDANKLL
jgi:predicted nucleotide-binding protein